MVTDVQKANAWKRIAASIFDLILIGILAVGIAALMSWALNYDQYYDDIEEMKEICEEWYGIDLDIASEEFDSMSDYGKSLYSDAMNTLYNLAQEPYQIIINLTLIMTTVSILVAFAVFELVMPLVFKNGQTIGKKIFGIAVIKNNGVKIGTVNLVIRMLLGKYTIETMIPALIITMIFVGGMGILGPVVIGVIYLADIILFAVTKNNTLIHDMLSNTIVVDMMSQKIFDSEEELEEYKKKHRLTQAK